MELYEGAVVELWYDGVFQGTVELTRPEGMLGWHYKRLTNGRGEANKTGSKGCDYTKSFKPLRFAPKSFDTVEYWMSENPKDYKGTVMLAGRHSNGEGWFFVSGGADPWVDKEHFPTNWAQDRYFKPVGTYQPPKPTNVELAYIAITEGILSARGMGGCNAIDSYFFGYLAEDAALALSELVAQGLIKEDN